MEPIKAIKLTDAKKIETIISNIIKSQGFKNYTYNNSIIKGEKCLLNCIYIKKGTTLKNKFNKKDNYNIPIIIENNVGGIYYAFKVHKKFNDLDVNILYKAEYQLIKRCHIDVWNYILNELNNN